MKRRKSCMSSYSPQDCIAVYIPSFHLIFHVLVHLVLHFGGKNGKDMEIVLFYYKPDVGIL